MNAKHFFVMGAIYALCSVVIGSLGSHALKPLLEQHDSLRSFEIGRDYLAYHGLVLMLLSMADQRWPELKLFKPGQALALGALVFSGALFLFSLSGEKLFAHAAPVGGVLMIGGWLWLIGKVIRSPR